MRDTLYNNVQDRRKEIGLTQADLAVATSVTRQTVIAIEKGNYVPSVLLALRLADALGCTVAELFYEPK